MSMGVIGDVFEVDSATAFLASQPADYIEQLDGNLTQKRLVRYTDNWNSAYVLDR